MDIEKLNKEFNKLIKKFDEKKINEWLNKKRLEDNEEKLNKRSEQFYCKGVIHYPELGDEPCDEICDDCKGV